MQLKQVPNNYIDMYSIVGLDDKPLKYHLKGVNVPFISKWNPHELNISLCKNRQDTIDMLLM